MVRVIFQGCGFLIRLLDVYYQLEATRQSAMLRRSKVTGLTLSIALLMSACAGNPAATSPFTHDPANTAPPLYYRPATIGSDSLYNPASAFFNYTFDTLQLSENFGTEDYAQNLENVWDLITHPRRSIDNEGGWRRFVNREIFPIDSDYRRDNYAALPNYALHLLGDGMTFRRDVQWFQARGYRFPRLAAASIAMVSEFLQEGLELDNTTDADAVADLYLFRPLGILLYSNSRAARAIHRHLEPAIWPTLISIDARTGKFINTGMSYVYRPPALSRGKARLFVYTGLTNLFGVSYATAADTWYTVAAGVAIDEIVRQRNIQADVSPSLGVFKDRRGNLLWSAVVNDAGGTRFRLNIYPGAIRRSLPLGVYFSLNDQWKPTAGINLNLPLGIGLSARNTAHDCADEDC